MSCTWSKTLTPGALYFLPWPAMDKRKRRSYCKSSSRVSCSGSAAACLVSSPSYLHVSWLRILTYLDFWLTCSSWATRAVHSWRSPATHLASSQLISTVFKLSLSVCCRAMSCVLRPASSNYPYIGMTHTRNSKCSYVVHLVRLSHCRDGWTSHNATT